MRIRIEIWSNDSEYSVFADSETNDFTIGFNQISIGALDFILDAYHIVKDWPEKSINNDITDGINYTIEFLDININKNWAGTGSVPENFLQLISLIDKYDPEESEERDRMREHQLHWIDNNLPDE